MQSLGSKVGVRGRPSLCPHLGCPPAGIHVSLVSLSVSNKEPLVACCVAGWASVPLLGPQAACSPSLALLSLLVFHPPSFFLRLAPLSLTTVFILGPNSFLSVGERKDYKDVYFRIMKPTHLPYTDFRFYTPALHPKYLQMISLPLSFKNVSFQLGRCEFALRDGRRVCRYVFVYFICHTRLCIW